MMRIVVTGKSGQVGAALLRALPDAAGTDRATLDLAEPTAIPARLDALAPQLIINCAAYTAVDQAEDERELAFAVNAEAPRAMAQWAAARGVPLIQFSTEYVFDGSAGPWREDDAPAPLNAYGKSKLAGENFVRAAQGPHLIVRTSWVYAARGKNFLTTIARLAGERDELRIVGDQIGAPTSAAGIADAVAQIVKRGDLATVFAKADGTVHLAAGGQTSWHGFASAIVAGLAKRNVALKAQSITPITTAEYPVKARRPHNSRLDMSRLRDVFGMTTRPWEAYLEVELDLLAPTLK
jgi:dTDP-4-dehydrorhamnose reductase